MSVPPAILNPSPVTVVLSRLPREEGDRMLPYDDATGLEVRAPKGKLSWGRGFNLEDIGSTRLFDMMAAFLVQECYRQLLGYAWFQALAATEPVRAGVFLDIAYNEGVHGLLHFPNMIAAATRKDWPTCAKECDISKTNAKVDAQRYAPLRQILLTGQT